MTQKHPLAFMGLLGTAGAFVVAVGWNGQAAQAAPISIVNSGFDATVINQLGFNYESTFYPNGSPMPDHTFTIETVAGSTSPGDPTVADGVTPIRDSATGAVIPASPPNANPNEEATVRINGTASSTFPFGTAYDQGSSPNTGIIRDTRDYVLGQGPTGPGAYIGMNDNLPRGIVQTLTTMFQPNTTYTFTAEVSDRRFGAGDNITFPSGGDVVSLGASLSLAGTTEPDGTFTFVPPAPGSTSLATFVFTTGPAGTPGDPTGNIALILRAQGFTGGDGIATSQAIFDNLALDATAVPEPASLALLGLAGLGAMRRRRTA